MDERFSLFIYNYLPLFLDKFTYKSYCEVFILSQKIQERCKQIHDCIDKVDDLYMLRGRPTKGISKGIYNVDPHLWCALFNISQHAIERLEYVVSNEVGPYDAKEKTHSFMFEIFNINSFDLEKKLWGVISYFKLRIIMLRTTE
jgi:hypothetical protein